ncbi:hypothetical protein [Paraburkholderia sp. UYCP14C]|uniref:hypothetical protein n=1 Tax=Paraburkholderia sp. UYCP14C TaxID=2511130 RepID=UPI00200708C3|nr:hypothetical protein [Paraburkholderia sp. UYCP14C]
MSEHTNSTFSYSSCPIMAKNVAKLSFVQLLSNPEQSRAPGLDLVDKREVIVSFPVLDLIDTKGADRQHFKYHWRRFATWTKETIDAELEILLNGYGSKFQVNFS